MALTIKVHERINENNIELQFITEKNKIEPLIGYIRQTLDDGYKASNLDGWIGPSEDSTLLDNLTEVRFALSSGSRAALAIYEGRLHGKKMTGITGIRSNPQYREGVIEIVKHDIANFDKWYWAEVSGPIEHYFKKYGGYPIPNIIAKELFRGKLISLNNDGFHYTRELGPKKEPAEKCIFGFKSIAEYNRIVSESSRYDAFRDMALHEDFTESDVDWAIGVVMDMDELYMDFGLGELLAPWKESLEKAVEILKTQTLDIDYVKIGTEILGLPVVEPHKVLEPIPA